MLAPALKYLHHVLLDDTSREQWLPMLAVYYLTYACDFRCPYCSDGEGRPYYQNASHALDADGALTLLGAIRRHCDHVVLTGGEPTRHEGLARILEGLCALDFDGVIFTTNGFELEPYLGALARSVTHLVFSLDTLVEERADSTYGVGSGTLARILKNIERADRLRDRRYHVVISSVVTPDNIDDLYEVYAFARGRGFRFAACPQLVGVKAHGALVESAAYRRFFDHLIDEKRRGNDIQGTVLYLEHMRDLTWFRCHPFTMLVVSPTGEVFYPCLEIGRTVGNLLEEPDLRRHKIEGERRYGKKPRCDTRCHSACALGFSLLVNHPSTILGEALIAARSLFSFSRRRAPRALPSGEKMAGGASPRDPP